MTKYLLLLLLSSCGFHVTSDPVRVDPITVNHNLSIDTNAVINYCKLVACSAATNQNQCANDCYSTFFNILGASSIK